MDPVLGMMAVAGVSVGASSLLINAPRLKGILESSHFMWKTYSTLISLRDHSLLCSSLNLFIFSQQHQFKKGESAVSIPYVHVDYQTQKQYIYSMKIPMYGTSKKFKTLWGNVYIRPLTGTGTELGGYQIYVYKRTASRLWFVNYKKVNILDYFINDIGKTSGIIPDPEIMSPPIINNDAYGKFRPDYEQILLMSGKINNVDSYRNSIIQRSKKVQVPVGEPYKSRREDMTSVNPTIESNYETDNPNATLLQKY